MSISLRRIDLGGMLPNELFLKAPPGEPGLVFFSSDGLSDNSRWSFLASNPSETIRWDGNQLFINDSPTDQDISPYMKALINNRKENINTHLPIVSGIIGSFDYEYGYSLLDLSPEKTQDNMVYLAIYDHILIYDHLKCEWYESIRNEVRSFDWQIWMKNDLSFQKQSWNLKPKWDFQRYKQSFEVLKRNILHGEIYQACLTFPFEGKSVRNTRHLFIQLLEKNPAPMAVYLEQGSRKILSLSPERFVHLNIDMLESKPIKGTRPRFEDPVEDKKSSEDLLKDKKEAAELNMITDLLRNDMAKISEPGSVTVLEHKSLQKCPSVWHTYSRIQSRLKENLTSWDVIEGMFPGGSISGCPKRRAVEILSSVEDFPRGMYTGCIGFISDNGVMDLNIAIRTLEQNNDNLVASFGGGIVYDSQLEMEYQECFDKALPFLSP